MIHHNIILSLRVSREAIEFSKLYTIMPKNLTTIAATKLVRGLRPSTFAADDFSPDNDNAVLYSTQAAFVDFLGKAVSTLQAQGYETSKSGSCFADLSASRTGNKTQYDPEYFHPQGAIVIPVLIDNDADGAACESRANQMPMMVNIRKKEGDGESCGHVASPAKSSSFPPLLPSSLTCCFAGLTSCGPQPDQTSSTLYPHAFPPRSASIRIIAVNTRRSEIRSRSRRCQRRSTRSTREEKKGSHTQSKTPSNSQRPESIIATKGTLQRIPSNATSLPPLKNPPSNNAASIIST